MSLYPDFGFVVLAMDLLPLLQKPRGLFQPFRPSALWSAQLALFDFSCFSSASRLDTGIRSRLRSGPDCATTCQDQPRITSGVGLSLLELAGKLEPAGRLEFAGVPIQFRGAVDNG